MLKYKGYTGSFEYDTEADILFGRVIDAAAVITFYGSSIKEIRQAFEESVDTYLETCAKKNIPPKKSFSGNIRLRISPELHKQSFLTAKSSGKSLNRLFRMLCSGKCRREWSSPLLSGTQALPGHKG
ncbi:MAG: type II toxin-antitoxin system HicB family antitoxin [Candidatus Electrothrix sp. EH2]|nr:type II toxin-antitoxin system HicB family antitoxin [Candidatus Electrothrix sp. EH2]